MPQHQTGQQVRISNAMSVDVEDYFHTEAMSKVVPRKSWDQMPCRVQGNTDLLFELLEAHRVRATFFFLGWVAERYPQLVRRAKELGHEIACHSYWHRPIYTLSPAEFREDTRRAKAVIEDAAGVRVEAYRAPSFSMTPGTEWAADILAENGFTYDSSVHPVAHDLYDNRHAPRKPYRIAKTSLVEIPISTIQLGKQRLPFCGGGYFRMLPFSYVCWGIRRLNRMEKQPAVFYIHPWEFDPDQPRLEASGRSRFRQYIGLSQTAKNLGRLCERFLFAPMNEAFSEQLSAIRRTAETVKTAG